jgi:hypothetical protein
MTSQTPSLAEAIALIESAAALLAKAESLWPKAIDGAFPAPPPPEAALIEELLHVATHETGNTLGFMLQDMKHLLMRVALRAKYPMFDARQIDEIVQRGWSTGFIHELHASHSSMSLAELSALVKSLCTEWGRLPSVSCAPATVRG